MLPPRRDPLIGTTLVGRFLVKRALASGAMARVYAGIDRQTGAAVALKVLAPSTPPGDHLVAAIRREADALTTLDHPNIVRTVAHGATPDGGYFIAMELVDGVSLTTHARAHCRRPQDGIGLLLQLCSALRHAHRKGMVHRDLKASNVLVARDAGGRAVVKLIDFGVVLRDGEGDGDGDPVLGGFHTSSPEQIRGDPVDHRSDIYSFGVLAYRLLVGRYPFHSKLPAEVLGMHLHAPYPGVPDEIALPDGVERVLARCLAKDPADRFQDVESLMDALSAALDVPTAFFVLPVEAPQRVDAWAWGLASVLGLLIVWFGWSYLAGA